MKNPNHSILGILRECMNHLLLVTATTGHKNEHMLRVADVIGHLFHKANKMFNSEFPLASRSKSTEDVKY